MIYRGTTPTFNFKLPFDTEDITKFNLVFMQRGVIALEKGKNDVLMDGKTVGYLMSETETLALKKGQLKIQLRVGFTNKRMVSQVVTDYVEDIIKDGVLA